MPTSSNRFLFHFKKWLFQLLKWLGMVFLGFLFCFVCLLFALQFDAVQNIVLPHITRFISQKLNTKVEIESVSIALMDKIVLNKVKLYDKNGIPMIISDEVYVGVISLDFFEMLFPRTYQNIIGARIIELHHAALHLYNKNGKVNIEEVFAEKDNDTTPSRRDLFIDFPNIYLYDFYFSFVDSSAPDSERKFIPEHWNYQNLHLQNTQLIGGFYFHKRDQMRIQIKHLTTQEKNTQLVVDTLSGSIKIKFPNPNYPDTIPYFQFSDMLIKLNQTRLDFHAIIWNDAFPTLFKPINLKDYRLNFNPSYVTFKDISYFIPQDTIPLKGRVDLEGKVNMNLTSIKAKDLFLTYNQRTTLNTDIRIDNYTKANDIFIQAKIKNSTLYTADIDTLLPTIKLPQQIANLGVVKIDGKFTGFPKDFVADATFEGPVGQVITDINMKILPEHTTYKGNIQTIQLNLDQVLGLHDTIIPQLNFIGKIDGKNFDLETMDTKAEFSVSNFTFFHTYIDSLKGNLNFNQKILKGHLHLLDPDAIANIDIAFDFQNQPTYNIYGDLQQFNLKAFQFTEKPIILASFLDIKLHGDSLDNFQGFTRLYKTELLNPEKKLNFLVEDVEVILKNQNNTKNINLYSDILNLDLSTNFLYKDLPQVGTEIWNELKLYFQNASDSLQLYYRNKNVKFSNQILKMNAEFFDIKPLFEFFEQKIDISKHAKIQFSCDYFQNIQIDFHFNADSLIYNKIKSYNLEISSKILKNQYANDWNIKANCKIDSIKSEGFNISQLNMIPQIQGNDLSFELKFQQNKSGLNNQIHWFAAGKIDTISYIKLDEKKSVTKLGDTYWSFNPENIIKFNQNYLSIDNLQLHHEEEFLNLTGEVSENKNRITLRVHDLAIPTIHKVYPIHSKLKGNIDAKIVIQKPFEEPLANINGQIENLNFFGVDYGKLVLISNWAETTNAISLNLGLVQQNDTILGLAGFYNPLDKLSPLIFHLTTHNLNLKLAQPFLDEYVYDLKGSISLENLSINGDIDKPQIFGLAKFNNASIGIKYLKTKFYITEKGSIRFNQSNLNLQDIEIKDIKGKTALVNGYVDYQKIREPKYKFLFSHINNFTILNTNKQDNELFYGKAIVKKGWIEIIGNTEVTTINADVTTDEGTAISIPINSYVKGSRLDYVYFKGQSNEKIRNKIKVSGVQLNMNIEATPEAEMNIIFDEKAGDIIHGNGSGNIALNITPDGEFSMMGKYTIQKGDYLFTTQNVINKKFLLEEGGTITWSGDPYEAAVDIKAIYKVNASLATLDTTLKNSTRVQVQVLMNLKGSLLNPEISLSLIMPSLTQNEAVTIVQQFRNIENDPQELNRQVFSLLMFGRFAPPNTFFGEGAGTSGVTSSLSEFLSNQLNSWLGQSLKEDFGVSLSSNRFDDVTLLVQAKFFNNKVTVSRDGAIMNTNQRDLTVGNVSIHIKLLPSDNKIQTKNNPGQLAIEVFNKENLGFANTLLSTNRGVGIFFKKDFDKLIEFIRSTSKK
jgi:hypothetical protein